MVKGTSRQVIVVHSPDKKLFDQAIFILKDDAEGITDEALLKEANQAIRWPLRSERKRKLYLYGPFWACCGALVTGFVWLLTSVL